MAEPAPGISWSSIFRVAPPSRAPTTGLKGDKIILPQTALEQLLSASSGQNPIRSRTFTAVDYNNPYASPLAQSQYGETQFQQLPNPLTFRLINKTNGNAVYAGIREFSAEEGDVVMSSYLLDALGIDLKDFGDGSKSDVEVTVQAAELPKGTYVRLRPLEAGYDPDDWKSLLERQLRESYTTLTRLSTLSVRGVKGEEFHFLIDLFKPEGDGICVVDTDLEVDIEALNEEQARETMSRIAEKHKTAPGTGGGSSLGCSIDIWKPIEGQVIGGDYVDYELPSWARSRPISIQLSEISGGEVDLLVSPKSSRQRALPRDSEHIFADFSSPQDGTKTITIPPTNAELEGAESLLISIHGYKPPDGALSTSGPRRYTLRAKAADIGNSSSNPVTIDSAEEHGPDDEQCKNCLQWVPKRTMVLHENFCLRNNTVCPHCKNVFKKGSEEWEAHWHCPEDEAHGDTAQTKAKHDDIHHRPRPCPSCGGGGDGVLDGTYASLAALARHRTTLCPAKLILCQFCHLEVPQEGDPANPSAEALISGLTAHELADGARTTDCHLCAAIVRLRDMAVHMKAYELDKLGRRDSKPAVCRNRLCGRTLAGAALRGRVSSLAGAAAGGRASLGPPPGQGGGGGGGQGPGNELGLCSLCFGPLYVSLYDPEGRALRRRIERRYAGQLMSGCGKRWCANEWCRTGRDRLGHDRLPADMKSVMERVKPLMASVHVGPGAPAVRDGAAAEPMFFCVDEASQRRRTTAEMLAAEGAWDQAWCIAACEAESGNLDRAREWLVNWAPTKY